MRNILYGLMLLMVFSSALANDEPVPGNTLLSELPEGSRIVVKKEISVDSLRGRCCEAILYGEYSGVNRDTDRKTLAGAVWPIYKVEFNYGSFFIRVSLDRPELDDYAWIYILKEDGKLPTNVNDFNEMLGSYFQIIYDDPAHYDPFFAYPGMEKSVVVDILMTKITTALKANNYVEALPHFELLEKSGVDLPESFNYYYTEALEKAGKKDEARAHASDYLKSYGKKGKYYAQVIDIMSRL